MMITAEELKTISTLGKTKQEAEIFLPAVEGINEKMLERATQGYFDIHINYSNGFIKQWGCLSELDFINFVRTYYECLGYSVVFQSSIASVDIYWEE